MRRTKSPIRATSAHERSFPRLSGFIGLPLIACLLVCAASARTSTPGGQTSNGSVNGVVTTTQTNPDGTTLESDTVPGASVTLTELDPQHNVTEKRDITDYPGTSQIENETDTWFRPDGSYQFRTVKDYTLNGQLQLRYDLTYDLHSRPISGTYTEPLTSTFKYWSPKLRDWQPVKPEDAQEKAAQLKTAEDHRAAAERATPKFTPDWKNSFRLSFDYSFVKTDLGVILPRDYSPNGNITGMLTYYDLAKPYAAVPGLTVGKFSAWLYDAPDQFANFDGIRIALPGGPLCPIHDGHFTLHIPDHFTGSLNLNLIQNDLPYDFSGRLSTATLDPPAATPRYPDPFNQALVSRAYINYLKKLWWDTWCDRMDYYDAVDDGAPEEVVNDYWWDVADDYDDLDDLLDDMTPDEIHQAANEMIQETNNFLGSPTDTDLLSDTPFANLDEAHSWLNFLNNEIHYATTPPLNLSWLQARDSSPYWTNPALSSDRLGAIRGPQTGDYNTWLNINGYPVPPICSSMDAYYFMPPSWLTPGLNQYEFDETGVPETDFSFYYLFLRIWADQYHLLKGQSTGYHVRLQGLLGLSPSAWRSGFYPFDLIGPSEYQLPGLNYSIPGSDKPGSMTLLLTDDTPAVIVLNNAPNGYIFKTYDYGSVDSTGTISLDGTLTSLMVGNFGLTAVGRLYLDPIAALGDQAESGPETVPAGEPTREDLEKKLKDAKAKALQLFLDWQNKWLALVMAWDNGLKTVNKNLQDKYEEAKKKAGDTREKAAKAADEAKKNPTEGNKNIADSAEKEAQKAENNLSDAKSEVIVNMKGKVQQDYFKAVKEEEETRDALDDAKKEGEAAQKALVDYDAAHAK